MNSLSFTPFEFFCLFVFTIFAIWKLFGLVQKVVIFKKHSIRLMKLSASNQSKEVEALQSIHKEIQSTRYIQAEILNRQQYLADQMRLILELLHSPVDHSQNAALNKTLLIPNQENAFLDNISLDDGEFKQFFNSEEYRKVILKNHEAKIIAEFNIANRDNLILMQETNNDFVPFSPPPPNFNGQITNNNSKFLDAFRVNKVKFFYIQIL